MTNHLLSSIIGGQKTTYSYDDNGNLIHKVGPGGIYNYSWNAANHLLGLTGPNLSATFTYDAEGKRTSKTVNGVITNFIYDGLRLIAEKDSSGTITAKYFYDDKDRLISMKKNGHSYYFHLNHRGDVIKITDASKNVVASYSYDPWGNILSSNGTFADQHPFRYAGYYWDSETRMYYLMARYYDPAIHRFISLDPAGSGQEDPSSLNGYLYAGNNPMNVTDPSGAWWSTLHRNLTNYWAVQMGFNGYEASAISESDVNVDYNLQYKNRTSWESIRNSGNPWLGNRSRHFNTWLIAGRPGPGQWDTRIEWLNKEMWDAAHDPTGAGSYWALQRLGRGLHSLQDRFSHVAVGIQTGSNYGVAWRKHPTNWWGDNPYDSRNKTRRDQTERATKGVLKRYYGLLHYRWPLILWSPADNNATLRGEWI